MKRCPKCDEYLESSDECTKCGFKLVPTISIKPGRIILPPSTSTTSTGSSTAIVGGTIPPRFVPERPERFSFQLRGNRYQINNLTESMNDAFRTLHEAYFQNQSLDWEGFTKCAMPFLSDNSSDYSAQDSFFENFTIIWEDLIRKRAYQKAIELWTTVLEIAQAWEDANRGVELHKGTPLFFLARTYRKAGDLHLAFTYAYNAIREDKRTVPDDYRTRPAYMYASLVDDERNLMYDYVSEMKSKIERYIQEYQTEMSSTFSYSDFERKFLHSNLEDVVHFFVYNLEMLIKQGGIPERMVETDFSKLMNLDTIFNLCLVIDKVLEEKFHIGRLAGNLIELIKLKSWGRGPRSSERFYQLFDFDTRDPPDTIVPSLLNQQRRYDNNPMNRAMQLVVLVWYLRNFGGHQIKAETVLSSHFPEITKAIMYALFISVETL